LSSHNRTISINSENKNIKIKAKNNSINYNILENKDNLFTYPYPITMCNSSFKKGNKDINRIDCMNNKDIFSLNDSYIKSNPKIIRVNRTDKYNKKSSKYNNYKNNYKTKSISIDNESLFLNNSIFKNNKFQSSSFAKKKQFNFKYNVGNNLNNNNNSRVLYTSTNKKNWNALKNSSNSPNYTITNKNRDKNITTNHKNIINNTFNKSEFTKDNKNDKFILSRIKINLKDKIIQDEKIQNKYLEKIKPLTKMINCYYREYNNKLNKYNPFFETQHEILCGEGYNYRYGTIFLNKKYDILRISSFGDNGFIDFKIYDIENTMVSSKIKSIIDIQRNYRKQRLNLKSDKDFVKEQFTKYPQFTMEEIEKCIKNKKYNFSLIISDGNIYELIICSYEDFKTWINGLAFLIKNKRDIILAIKQNEKKNS
jgi:hypothetical protein